MIVLPGKKEHLFAKHLWAAASLYGTSEQQRASSAFRYEKSGEREFLFLSEHCCYSSYDGDEFLIRINVYCIKFG